MPSLEWARAALSGAIDERAEPPPCTRFGGYELLEELGRGATGVVYRSRRLDGAQPVALKLMLGADFASEQELQRFRFGAQTAAELDHPNIVPVLQVGEHEGRPFFTMRLLEGGSLALALPRLRGAQVSVARLLAKVARAVHHAHERGVLHRDLKPENVVLDQRDEPYVVDFGLAKRLDRRAIASKTSAIVGSAGYMAPEQAGGDSRELTFAADIYSLGAILYELLTGELPVQGQSLAELFERLLGREPVPAPRTLDASIDHELELVCLKCLEKEPARRYATALELAQDLERWLRFEPVMVAPRSRAGAAWRWCRGHPVAATLLCGALLVATATALAGLSIAREQEQALRREVLRVNSYAAQAKAGQVLMQLRALSLPVARCAADPRVVARLAPEAAPDAAPVNTERLLRECGAGPLFDGVALLDRRGVLLARSPSSRVEWPGRDLSARDYFLGPRRIAADNDRTVHVARVHRAEDSGRLQVVLAAPVYDPDNSWLGVVSAHVEMDAFLESLRLRDDGRQWAELAGVLDHASAPAAASGAMTLLGAQRKAESATSERWRAALSRFRDSPRERGRDQFGFAGPERALEDDYHADPAARERRLAGFAPVGDTGYAVLVQSHDDAALEVPQRALARVVGGAAGVLALGTALVLLCALWLRGRLRSALQLRL